MLTTYQRLMEQGKVTRTGSTTYDNRSQDELVRQLQAEVKALRQRVKEMENEHSTEGRDASDRRQS